MNAITSAGLHSPTVEAICRAANISRRMYFNAQKVHWAGCPELLRQVIDGEMTVNLALELVQFDHDSQRLIMAEFYDIPPRERLAFVRRIAQMEAAQVVTVTTPPAATSARTNAEPARFAIGLPSQADGTCHQGAPA